MSLTKQQIAIILAEKKKKQLGVSSPIIKPANPKNFGVPKAPDPLKTIKFPAIKGLMKVK